LLKRIERRSRLGAAMFAIVLQEIPVAARRRVSNRSDSEGRCGREGCGQDRFLDNPDR
jgi:hypothetical protein